MSRWFWETTGSVSRAHLAVILLPACGGERTEPIDPATTEMVRLEATVFVRGHAEEEPGDYGSPWKENQLPSHEVSLSAFWIDVHEVTVADWVSFLDDVGGERHHHPLQPLTWNGTDFDSQDQQGDTPARQVSWYDATVYCGWAAKRLPTEAEWELAAKGAEDADQVFPWGDDGASCETAVYFTNRTLCEEHPVSVGSRSPGGDSPYGLQDMAGNVAEWVSDGYARYPSDAVTDPLGEPDSEYRILRGGGFRDTSDLLRTMSRVPADPADRSEGVGFRCAMDG